MNLLITSVFIGSMLLTSYRSVKNQTDDSPNYTSTGEHVSVRGCAVSQDLLKKNGGPLDYGDLLYIEGVGFKFVNDTMNIRHKHSVDIWVATLNDEKKFIPRRGKIWLIHPIMKEK